MNFSKNYYLTLDVAEQATQPEIKAAYRRLAMLYHPDRNPGDAQGEEILKEINEAYETLGDEAQRFVYDEYRSRLKAETAAEEKKTKQEAQTKEQPNRRTYKKTRKVTEEIRTYLKGKLVVKFYGKQKEKDNLNILHEVHHTIHPTEAEVEIEARGNTPFDDVAGKVYTEQSIFSSFLKRPIRCRVRTEKGDVYYSLDIRDIRIGNVKITDVMYEGNDVLGTLEGELYGYLQTFREYEVEDEVTECFGETGRVDEKEENGVRYTRKEYYHHDCSVYWGPWVQVTRAKPFAASAASSSTYSGTTSQHSGGGVRSDFYRTAAQTETVDYSWLWWLLFLFFLILLFPSLGLLFAIIAGLFLLSFVGGFIIRVLGRIVQVLWGLFLLCFLFFGVKSCFQNTGLPEPVNHSPGEGVVKTTVSPQRRDNKVEDSLITHYMRWQDFHGNPYSAGLSVLASDIRSSSLFHANLAVPLTYSLTPVYQDMLAEDSSKLRFVYLAFDSVMKSGHLNEYYRAALLVSCVQNFPYAVVVDRNCDAGAYTDNFTRSYLQNCTGDCCVGYETYGVRTPVEMLGDLRGDCDSRALLLYALLKHFGYNAALLTSNYYKHAIVAVHFSRTVIPHTVIKVINNKPYYVWETTSFGFDVGQLPQSISDMSHWEVSLLTAP